MDQQPSGHAARIVCVPWQRKELPIGGILPGNNLVDIAAAAIAPTAFIKLVGDARTIYATVPMTLLVLIFSAVLPNTYPFHGFRFQIPGPRGTSIKTTLVEEADNEVAPWR